jgi:hypothetical protein
VEENTDCYYLRKRPLVCKYARWIPTLRMRMPLQNFPFDVINLDTEVQFGWTTHDLKVVAGEMEIDQKVAGLTEYVLVEHKIIVQEHLYEYYTVYDDCEEPYPEVRVNSPKKSPNFPNSPNIPRSISPNSHPWFPNHSPSKFSPKQYPNNQVIIRLTLARNPWYYIMRLVVPQLLLSAMELTSFLCEPDAVADRFSISGTIILSEIALYFVAVDMLPKVPYVTRIDTWFSWCFLLVFLSCAQNGLNFMVMTVLFLTSPFLFLSSFVFFFDFEMKTRCTPLS